jgi:hypothetical protein
LFDGAAGEFRRSRKQQMWGLFTGEFRYSTAGATGTVIARPPKPVSIPGPFDCVEMWGYGDRWSYNKDASTPAVNVTILVTDAQGKEFRIPLAGVGWKQWWLIHSRAPQPTLDKIALPAALSGIEIADIKNSSERYFYCDSLAFYTEELKPLQFKPQPKRNLLPYRGQISGANTGPGLLPFPTRESTILPTNKETRFQVGARATTTNRFELRYLGKDASVTYTYAPQKGTLSELEVSVNGAPEFHPLDGGGLRFAEDTEKRAAEGQLISASVLDGVVRAKFRFGMRTAEYALRLWQKSLVLEVWCDGGEVSELDFGQVSGVSNPRLIQVPYLTYGGSNPRVLVSGTAAAPVFTSVWFDWYRTNASAPYFVPRPKVTADTAQINGGMRYLPRTGGRRNNVYERIFVTNSPVYEETLPTIANPPSLRKEEGKQVIWTVTSPADWKQDHERCREIRSYGLDKIMQHSHEVTWRDEGESFTMRLHAAPQKGGDGMLQWYVKAQNGLGWLQGAYTNYTDFCPVNMNWSPDRVQRTSDGEWRRAWARNYALKPAYAVELDDYYAQRIKEKFGTKMSYTDVHTAVAPWSYCDFDARVPGAGTMAATFYAYGQLLLNDQRVYGPTQSEGTYQWLYAGLESGSYGWVYTDYNLLTQPLDVAFHLMKIHPLQCDYGMGYTHYYLDKIDPDWKKSPKSREYIDLFLATTIAYGNMGWLVTEFGNGEYLARSYYMMQQLQQQYAFVGPRVIEYAGPGGQFMSASQAHAAGTMAGTMADSRLHVVYANGVEVYVNRAAAGTWTVKDAGGNAVDLPVSGWLAFNPANGFYEESANTAGKRIDYVKAPEFEFLDGRGEFTRHGNLAAKGSVALRKSGRGLELIDIYGNDRLGLRAAAPGALRAYGPSGNDLGEVEMRSTQPGWYEFRTVPGGRRYVVSRGAAGGGM